MSPKKVNIKELQSEDSRFHAVFVVRHAISRRIRILHTTTAVGMLCITQQQVFYYFTV
jgi:hypothetical protein